MQKQVKSDDPEACWMYVISWALIIEIEYPLLVWTNYATELLKNEKLFGDACHSDNICNAYI